MLVGRRARRERRRQLRLVLRPPQGPQRARADRRRGRRGAAAQARGGPRHPRLPAEPARRSRSAAACRRSQYQLTLTGPDTAELYRVGPAARGEAAIQPDAGRRRTPTCCSRTRRSTSTSTATRPPSLGVSATADRGRALHRLRHPPDLHHLRAAQPVPGDHGAQARVPDRHRRPLAALRALVDRPARAARLAGQDDARARARSPSTTPASSRR